MNFILWIIIGAVAGWLASIIMKTDAQQGLLMDIIIGIVGGFIGGFVLSAVGVNTADDGLIASLVTATIGAVILLGIVKLIRRET